MKCLVINLDRSSERLTRMAFIFARIGVQFERVEAIDGNFLSEQQREAVTRSDGIREPLTHTEVACFLSHRKAWMMIAEGAEPYGTVFEDDLVVSGNAARWLLSHDWIPAGTDAVKLETFGDRTWVDRRMIDLGDGYNLTNLRGTHWGAAAYVLSRDFARRLLEETERFSAVVDDVLFSPEEGILNQIKCYQFEPAICAQSRRFDSDYLAPSSSVDIGGLDFESFLDTTIEQSKEARVKPVGLAKLKYKFRRTAEKVARRISGQIHRRIPFDLRVQ
ncbi:glycosyltransferase family 25 protein [Mesorhizobium sp. ANAO-SY3R2]|uniref:glycosyltransferase family 25 protein n=1 Tax=Mesorhizobium sp. ANAO-SY3R2 TaxID=3166644 RepID=UPI003671BF0F